jgi:hypothetical protein
VVGGVAKVHHHVSCVGSVFAVLGDDGVRELLVRGGAGEGHATPRVQHRSCGRMGVACAVRLFLDLVRGHDVRTARGFLP